MFLVLLSCPQGAAALIQGSSCCPGHAQLPQTALFQGLCVTPLAHTWQPDDGPSPAQCTTKINDIAFTLPPDTATCASRPFACCLCSMQALEKLQFVYLRDNSA